MRARSAAIRPVSSEDVTTGGRSAQPNCGHSISIS
jgi:hypothetical protein